MGLHAADVSGAVPGVSVPGWNLSVDVPLLLCSGRAGAGGMSSALLGAEGAGNDLEPGHWHKSAPFGSVQLRD